MTIRLLNMMDLINDLTLITIYTEENSLCYFKGYIDEINEFDRTLFDHKIMMFSWHNYNKISIILER